MKPIHLPALLSILVLCSVAPLIAGCAGSQSLGNPPVVLAGQTYSKASLSGTYAFNEFGVTAGDQHDGDGTLVFDGNGNLTGTLTDYYVGTPACQFTLAGTYTVATDASGTATVTTTPTGGCTGHSQTFGLQLAQQGQALTFAESDGQYLDTGSAIKQ